METQFFFLHVSKKGEMVLLVLTVLLVDLVQKTMGPVILKLKRFPTFCFVILIYYSNHESNSHTIMTTDKTHFIFDCWRHPEGNLSLTDCALKHSLVRPRAPKDKGSRKLIGTFMHR